jgi:hypothetical protein
MKKHLIKAGLIIALIVTANQSSFAQLNITHGPILGANFANLSGDDADNTSMRTSFHIGYGVDFNLNEQFSIGIGIQYSSKGANVDFGGDDVPLSLNYLDYPVFLKYKLENRLFFEAGPYTSLLMGVKLDGESDDPNGDPYKDSYKGMDFGLGLGVGYTLENGIGFKANYNMGLSSVADDSDTNIKNSVIKLSAFYTFGSAD